MDSFFIHVLPASSATLLARVRITLVDIRGFVLYYARA